MNIRFHTSAAIIALCAPLLTCGCSKKLTRTKAAKAIQASVAFQQPKVIRFPVGMIISGSDLSRAYPVLSREYPLLNNANVASLQPAGPGQYQFAWGALGQSRTKAVGPNEYELAYGVRELIQVNGVAESGEGRADVDFTWQWKPILIEHPRSSWEEGFNQAITSWLKDAHEVGTGKLIGGVRKTTVPFRLYDDGWRIPDGVAIE